MAATRVLPRPRNTDRLFLAVLPDAAAQAQVLRLGAALRAELGLTGKPFAPDRLHVTLHFLGDYPGLPQPLIEAVSRIAAATAAHEPAFTLTFDRVGSFPRRHGRRPFVMRGGQGLAGVLSLQRSLSGGLHEAALAAAPGDLYTPHLTLLYDPLEVAVRPVPTLITWSAGEFVLVRSRIGRGLHEVLARWALRPLA